MDDYGPEEKSRRFTIFLLSGSLPDRIHLVGLGSDSNSYCRDLALEADRDTDGSEFDKRVDAKDTIARPLWAKGAIVLVGSADSRRLHTALEACSIILDCRYVVVAEECASRVFVSMAQMAELAPSSRDICRRKSVVNKMHSFTVDPENFGEHEDYALWQRHFFFQDLLWRTGAFPEDTEVEACLRAEMHEYIKASSVPWSFCFRNTKLKEGSKDLKNAAQVAGKGAEGDQDKKGGQHRQDPGPDSTCAKELQSFEAPIREAPAPRYYHEAGWPRAHGQFTAPVPHRGRGAPAPWAAANQSMWSVAPWVGYDSLGEAPWGCYAPIPSHNTFWPSTWQDY